MRERPFRFGLQAFEGASASEWFDTGRACRARRLLDAVLVRPLLRAGRDLGRHRSPTGRRGPAHVDRDGGRAHVDAARRLPRLRLRLPPPGRAGQGDGDARRAVRRAARGRARCRMGARRVRRSRCRRCSARACASPSSASTSSCMRAHWSGEQIDVARRARRRHGVRRSAAPRAAGRPADHDRGRCAQDPRPRRSAGRHRQPQLRQLVRAGSAAPAC